MSSDDFVSYTLFDKNKPESDAEPMVCTICLGEFKHELQDCTICHGTFHGDCIQKWCVCAGNCPLCRAEPIQTVRNRSLEIYCEKIAKSQISACPYCNIGLSPVTLPDGTQLTTTGEVLAHHYQLCPFYLNKKYEKHIQNAQLVENIASTKEPIKAINLKLKKAGQAKSYVLNVPDKKHDDVVQIQLNFRNHKTVATKYLISCKLITQVTSVRLPMRFGVIIQCGRKMFSNIVTIEKQNEPVELGRETYIAPTDLKTIAMIF